MRPLLQQKLGDGAESGPLGHRKDHLLMKPASCVQNTEVLARVKFNNTNTNTNNYYYSKRAVLICWGGGADA